MGTHPIFESDFDCLTDWLPCVSHNSRKKNERKIGCTLSSTEKPATEPQIMSESTGSEIQLDKVKKELENTEQKLPEKKENCDEKETEEEEDSFPELVTQAVDKSHQTKRRGTGFVFDESAEETEKQKKALQKSFESAKNEILEEEEEEEEEEKKDIDSAKEFSSSPIEEVPQSPNGNSTVSLTSSSKPSDSKSESESTSK